MKQKSVPLVYYYTIIRESRSEKCIISNIVVKRHFHIAFYLFIFSKQKCLIKITIKNYKKSTPIGVTGLFGKTTKVISLSESIANQRIGDVMIADQCVLENRRKRCSRYIVKLCFPRRIFRLDGNRLLIRICLDGFGSSAVGPRDRSIMFFSVPRRLSKWYDHEMKTKK